MNYNVETKMGDKWITRAKSFASVDDANKYAEHLATKERELSDYRVVPAKAVSGGMLRSACFAAALAIVAVGCAPRTVGEESVFVCYVDDKLTESHVGVRSAENRGSDWYITYMDGQPMFYLQQRGEYCGLEQYATVKTGALE